MNEDYYFRLLYGKSSGIFRLYNACFPLIGQLFVKVVVVA